MRRLFDEYNVIIFFEDLIVILESFDKLFLFDEFN